jgi:hypothetical protein
MPDYLKPIVMVTQLDVALHGASYARDASPKEVWEGLLEEVVGLAAGTLPLPTTTEGESA